MPKRNQTAVRVGGGNPVPASWVHDMFVLGDAVYGRADPRSARPFLHAAALAFEHPVSGESLRFTAPLPADLQATLSSGPPLSALPPALTGLDNHQLLGLQLRERTRLSEESSDAAIVSQIASDAGLTAQVAGGDGRRHHELLQVNQSELEALRQRLQRYGLSIKPGTHFQITNPEGDPRYRDYVSSLLEVAARKGVTLDAARSMVRTWPSSTTLDPLGTCPAMASTT